MPQPSENPWLHRFALLTAAATFVLLGAGGLVTSHEAGMAVPDWPNTYGYNLFFFPMSKWVGGIFYEHTHRLMASGVGLLTSILALWLYGKSARPFMRWTGLVLLILGIANELLLPKRWADGIVSGTAGLGLLGASFFWPRCEPAAKWLRRLGLIAFVTVVLQGVLGGLRVVLFKDQIGIFHATLAQLFFVLTCAIVLFTSQWWQGIAAVAAVCDDRSIPETNAAIADRRDNRNLRLLFFGTTLLILFQLFLGATMRHQHAGLAIPDFPLAYGKLWPAADAESVAHYNQQRVEIAAANPITAFQIELQMAHRIVAAFILAGVTCCAWRTRARRLAQRQPPEGGTPGVPVRLVYVWLGLILVQVALGAFTILSNKAADLATAHVLAGALSLATGAILCIVDFRSPASACHTATLSGVTAGREEGSPTAIKAAAATYS
jgi:cytochrome c oxidase assembly protein subunit 15